jgi:hypothetical protein
MVCRLFDSLNPIHDKGKIMTQALNHKKIAILVADGFEQVELTQPKQAFEEAGATVDIISPNSVHEVCR